MPKPEGNRLTNLEERKKERQKEMTHERKQERKTVRKKDRQKERTNTTKKTSKKERKNKHKRKKERTLVMPVVSVLCFSTFAEIAASPINAYCALCLSCKFFEFGNQRVD